LGKWVVVVGMMTTVVVVVVAAAVVITRKCVVTISVACAVGDVHADFHMVILEAAPVLAPVAAVAILEAVLVRVREAVVIKLGGAHTPCDQLTM
jgi:hypothetical protein